MKRKGRISKRAYKKMKAEELKNREARQEILWELLGYCIYGGSLTDIKRVVRKHDYNLEELLKALETLKTSGSSALEVMTAKESIEYMEKYIKVKYPEEKH